MADFAVWVEAAAPVFGWDEGQFLDAYTSNRSEANEQAIETSSVASVFQRWATRVATWSGTATALLSELTIEAGEETARQKG